ncbi:glycoside hydrolase family 26 protein [Parafrankia discariae]|uniref:glycoside hydrolase family 26 protein n=1 Tax=Parafrankia discariae TaxID=365528 RepID=UPI00037C7B34|nr:glycosyl hydrolase [Parafrankia discariae]
MTDVQMRRAIFTLITVAITALVALTTYLGQNIAEGPGPDAPAPTPTTSPTSARPPATWLSGVYPEPVQNAANVTAFGTWRGDPTDIALTFVTRNQGWQHIVGSESFIWGNFRGWPGKLIISVPPWPENTGGTYTACARGDYDTQWRTFGTTLKTQNRAGSIIRIAWEANGNWFQWSATNPALYKTCWQHIAAAIKSTDSAAQMDWAINAHYSQNPPSHNPLDLYPGDTTVDIVSIDAYDHYPPSPSGVAFDTQCNAQGGACWLAAFARGHSKLFAVGEWGVVSGRGPDGGGDNPLYIEKMRKLFADNADILAYEVYFSDTDERNVKSDIWRVPQNPRSGAAYRELW